MIFIKSSNLPSNQLRADQIANELGAKVYLNDLPETQDTVVFVKDAKPELVMKANKQGCKIVYDPIDTWAYGQRQGIRSWHYLVDTVIAYNPVQKMLFKQWFKNVVIIPHQWDTALDGEFCEYDEFRPAYIGHGFNMHEAVKGVDFVTDPEEMITLAPRYNCHVTVRDENSYQAIHKPATKVVTAAAVGAVVVTTKDPSAYWLLKEEYPYWCTPETFSKTLEQCGRDMGSGRWDDAIKILDGVRNKTDLRSIAQMYTLI